MKKGFTLIELLAVIVILAIIALIATPIILNIINDAKKESLARSAELYIKGVEQAIAKENLNGEFNPTTCIGTTTLTCTMPDGTTKTLKVEIEGKSPNSATIAFENGKVKKDSTTTITFESGTVSYDENGKIKVVDQAEPTTYKTYTNGEAVYFNVDAGTKCESSSAVSTTGTKTGCMKFYAFNDEEGKNTVNLILDHNTTATVAWYSIGRNDLGPNELLTQLYNDTKDWQGTITPENYTMNQTGQPSNANYTIDYTGYKARLITANEIAQITGYEGWDEDYYYFDSLTYIVSPTCKSGNTSGCQYGWLYDRTSTSCTTYGCSNNSDPGMIGDGYWTASSAAYSTDRAWYVWDIGELEHFSVNESSHRGVRPVITILKSKLN